MKVITLLELPGCSRQLGVVRRKIIIILRKQDSMNVHPNDYPVSNSKTDRETNKLLLL